MEVEKSIIGWDPVAVHEDAYIGYPSVQESIRRDQDAGGVAAVVVSASVEVAA